MTSPLTNTIAFILASFLSAQIVGCEPVGPRTDSQTNWLKKCGVDADCNGLRCVCGACTSSCGDVLNCADLPGSSCVAAEDPGAIALCSGSAPPSLGLCLPRCSNDECPAGTSCVAGVCAPTPEPFVHIALDESRRFQSLVGIGAGIGYTFDEIARHPRKSALYDAMFSDTRIGVLWLRNRYVQPGAESLSSTSEIVAAATERLGKTPLLMLNSASPPAALKANNSTWCEGNPETCTLARLPDGSFDYAGFASHWRASLEAYAAAGMTADYISIQNNPDWVPAVGNANEACRFLPAQGTTSVRTDAGDVQVEYPGYAEALDAVLGELAALASIPKIIAPDTAGTSLLSEYVAELDPASVDAVGHHLYGTDTTNLSLARMAELGELAQEFGRPIFQSEMYADPLTTAVLMHAALAVEGASVYVHNGFVAAAGDIEPDANAIVNLTADDFSHGDVYYVFQHYSRHIESGWTRIAADSDSTEVLASAWRAPDGGAVVVVLTNPGLSEQVVRLDPNVASGESSAVTRTALEGVERAVELGALSNERVVRLPAHAMATVVLER